ncbi:MAG: type II toxin-antitoxin system VapC family toxin [Pseudonocardiaceae bacterium]
MCRPSRYAEEQRREPQLAKTFAFALAVAQAPRISAANYLETAIVIDASRDPIASRHVDDLCTRATLVIEPVTADQAAIARAAYRDFGKSSSHSAQLNFGDCFAYALAKSADEPLLFKGEGFSRTDLTPAAPALPA